MTLSATPGKRVAPHEEKTMAEEKLTGGCHCGALRFETEADLSRAIECNCSICSKKGLMLTFTARDKFTLTEGADKAQSYKFNRHVIDHRFCPACGVQPFAYGQMPDGTLMAAINVRCVDDVDLPALHPAPFDGRSK
jgi:hypothetical protein